MKRKELVKSITVFNHTVVDTFIEEFEDGEEYFSVYCNGEYRMKYKDRYNAFEHQNEIADSFI